MKAPTRYVEAYEFYLKAKHIYEKRENIKDTGIAQGLLYKAIEIDNNLLAAKDLLGKTYFEIGDYGKAMKIYISALTRSEELDNNFWIGRNFVNFCYNRCKSLDCISARYIC